MLPWGVIGLLAGALSRPLKKSRIALCAFGAPAGPIGEKPERIKKKYGLFSYAGASARFCFAVLFDSG